LANLADLILIDRDFLTSPPEELARTAGAAHGGGAARWCTGSDRFFCRLRFRRKSAKPQAAERRCDRLLVLLQPRLDFLDLEAPRPRPALVRYLAVHADDVQPIRPRRVGTVDGVVRAVDQRRQSTISAPPYTASPSRRAPRPCSSGRSSPAPPCRPGTPSAPNPGGPRGCRLGRRPRRSL